MVLDVRPLDDDTPLAAVERPMIETNGPIPAFLMTMVDPSLEVAMGIDQVALDTAIRRFPYWIWQWRSRAINAADLHLLVPGIIAEYHRVVAERRKARVS